MSGNLLPPSVSDLIARFEAFQIGPERSMVLLAVVKIGLPELFDGTFDLDVLESFFFTVERYFELTGLDDDH